MTDFDTRLTALDRALIGASSGDFHDDVVERARAFEAYLTEKRDVEPTPEPPAEEPRPFRSGDRVLVAEGASFNCAGRQVRSNIVAPCEAVVCGAPDHDGDISVEHAVTGRRHLVAPEFLTLAPEPRPFQVGDKVVVSKGAEYLSDAARYPATFTTLPVVAEVVSALTPHGNYTLAYGDRRSYSVHPSFLTLKEAAK